MTSTEAIVVYRRDCQPEAHAKAEQEGKIRATSAKMSEPSSRFFSFMHSRCLFTTDSVELWRGQGLRSQRIPGAFVGASSLGTRCRAWSYCATRRKSSEWFGCFAWLLLQLLP